MPGIEPRGGEFRSSAQRRMWFAQHPESAERVAHKQKKANHGKVVHLPRHVGKAEGLASFGKAASSGTFTRAGSTIVPMAQAPARRGQMPRFPGGYSRGSRIAKGQPFVPTPTLLQQGKPPSMMGAAGTNMGTLAGQRTGNPQTSAQAMTGASGQQAAKKPAQVGQAAQQKPTGTLVPAKAVKPQVTKADLHPDDRLRSQTPYHGRRPRRYDPESRRQRTHGAATAALGIGGGVSTGLGARQVVRRSKRVKGAIAIDRKAGTRLGLGGAGLGAAYLIHRRAEDPRRRRYT